VRRSALLACVVAEVAHAVIFATSYLVLAAAPAPARAADRLDRAATALRTTDVFVHPDLSWLVDDQDRAAIAGLVATSPVPMKVAVLPGITEDESGGDSRRILAGLWARLRRPGVYVTVDQNGYFDLVSPGVRRRIRVSLLLVVPSVDTKPAGTIVERLRELVQIVRAAPPGAPSSPPRVTRALDPVYTEERGTGWAEAIAAGVVIGLFAAFAVRRGAGLVGRVRRLRAG
jgi:hypothetical protein